MARGAESSPCLCSPCALEEQMGKSENGNPASRGLERVAWTSWPRTQDPRLWFPMHQTDWKRATERGLGRERPQRGHSASRLQQPLTGALVPPKSGTSYSSSRKSSELLLGRPRMVNL